MVECSHASFLSDTVLNLGSCGANLYFDMSVDISWENITQGPDGDALADQIRDFMHDKFQQVHLPRFIKFVHVHTFAFGSACPEVEIKDVSDPLPDFYEDGESDESTTEVESPSGPAEKRPSRDGHPAAAAPFAASFQSTLPTSASVAQDLQSRFERGLGALNTEFSAEALPRIGTPGIPGGTSNFSYFHHLPLGGLSGSHTPLAAVASGTPFSSLGWHHNLPHTPPPQSGHLHHSEQQSNAHVRSDTERRDTFTRPSTANTLITSSDLDPASNPSTPAQLATGYQRAEKVSDDPASDVQSQNPSPSQDQSQPSDLQVVARVQYSGDVRMMLTAEILLDYPMPSFVNIPLKLSITGITFDGVAILAYIRKRMHLCFLDPEDAETLVGEHVTAEEKRTAASKERPHSTMNGLIKDIRIESEIGRQESGKQVLKNVGKVENFVLEQIRRIFEEEFVFPSFWTFLV